MESSETLTEMADKDTLKKGIILRLKAINPNTCLLAAGLHVAIKSEWNFDEIMKMIASYIEEDKFATGKVIGFTTVDLILKYLK